MEKRDLAGKEEPWVWHWCPWVTQFGLLGLKVAPYRCREDKEKDIIPPACCIRLTNI